MPKRRITQGQKEIAIGLYRSGVSAAEVGERLGFSESCILSVLKSGGVQIRIVRLQPLNDQQISEAEKLYESGLTLSEVGASLGIDRMLVYKALTKRGVTFRPASQRPRISETHQDLAADIYRSGRYLKDVANEFGTGIETARVHLLKMGVKMRATGRQKGDGLCGAMSPKYREGPRCHRPAHQQVWAAVKSGRLIKPKNCERCGKVTTSRSLHAHHCDYNKPLDVMWLCASCHDEWHAHHRAIPFSANESAEQ